MSVEGDQARPSVTLGFRLRNIRQICNELRDENSYALAFSHILFLRQQEPNFVEFKEWSNRFFKLGGISCHSEGFKSTPTELLPIMPDIPLNMFLQQSPPSEEEVRTRKRAFVKKIHSDGHMQVLLEELEKIWKSLKDEQEFHE